MQQAELMNPNQGALSYRQKMKSSLSALDPNWCFFVKTIASRYNAVLYHNFEHASHVTACIHQLILILREAATDSVSRRSSDVTSSSSLTNSTSVSSPPEELCSQLPSTSDTFISSNPMVQLALVITALIHDVEHQGVGNKQLVNEKSPIAIKYKGKSVAENNSFDVSSMLLHQKQFHNLRQSMFGDLEDISDQLSLDGKEYRCIKNHICKEIESYKALFHQISHEVIMATDISCPERLGRGKSKWTQAFDRGSDTLSNPLHCGLKPSKDVPNLCASLHNGVELNGNEEEKEAETRMRRSSFPPLPRIITTKFPRRLSAPHQSAAPIEFIADPFPDQTKLPPPTRNFSCNRHFNVNGPIQIVCPLCNSSCTRDEAFNCLPYLRVSSILEQMIQAADVGHTMQSWAVFKKWNEKLYYELWAAQVQCRGPDCLGQWFEGQISFFDKYIFPLAQRLKQCGVFGSLGSLFYENASLNRERWMIEGYNLCREMHENASKLVENDQPI
jgi:hypothetical protein